MKKKNIIIITIKYLAVVLCFVEFAHAQNSAKLPLDSQYHKVVKEANNFQEYKVIKQVSIERFWANIKDSLSSNKGVLKNLNNKISSQNSQMNTLQNKIQQAETNLQKAKTSIDEIYFLGIIPMTKNNYGLFMWALVILFALAAIVLFFKSKKSNTEASHRIKLYNELSEEYKSYKSKANDNEKKLARELQDERNKLAELTGR